MGKTFNIIEAPEHVIDALVSRTGNVDLHILKVLPAWMTTQEKKAWRQENWGVSEKPQNTVRNSPTRVTFTTSGAAPMKALEKLPEKFPNETIVYAYAGEDLGNDYGLMESDGEGWSTVMNVPKGSVIALQFSSMVRTGKPYLNSKLSEIRNLSGKLSSGYDGNEEQERADLVHRFVIEKFELQSLNEDLKLFVESAYGKSTKLDHVDFTKLETYFKF